MLPWYVNENNIFAGQLMMDKHPNCYVVKYGTMRSTHLSFEADTEADCRSKMLIYLVENGLMILGV